jgi:hypothetical protein
MVENPLQLPSQSSGRSKNEEPLTKALGPPLNVLNDPNPLKKKD